MGYCRPCERRASFNPTLALVAVLVMIAAVLLAR